jgi:hypothetical protein
VVVVLLLLEHLESLDGEKYLKDELLVQRESFGGPMFHLQAPTIF